MKFFLVLLAVASPILAQIDSGAEGGQGSATDCDLDAAKQTLSECISDKAEEMESKKAERADEKAAKKAEMVACFTDNQCDDPSDLKEQMQACKQEAIMNGFGGDMVDCIEGKGIDIPDALLNKLFKRGKGKGKGRKGRRGRRGHRGNRGEGGNKEDKEERKAARMAKKEQKLNAILDKTCANGNRDAAKQCVMALKKERKEAKKEKREEKREERRASGSGGKRGGRGKGKGKGLKACFKALPKECRRPVMTDLCTCAEPLKNDPTIFQATFDKIQQCKANVLDINEDDDNDDEDEDIDQEEAKKRGKKMGKILKLVCGGGRRGGRRGGRGNRRG